MLYQKKKRKDRIIMLSKCYHFVTRHASPMGGVVVTPHIFLTLLCWILSAKRRKNLTRMLLIFIDSLASSLENKWMFSRQTKVFISKVCQKFSRHNRYAFIPITFSTNIQYVLQVEFIKTKKKSFSFSQLPSGNWVPLGKLKKKG